MTSAKNRIFSSLAIALVIASTFAQKSFAQTAANRPLTFEPPQKIGLYAIEDDELAAKFAEKLINDYEQAEREAGIDPKERTPIYIFHVGETLPFRLRNILVRLEHADFKVIIDLVKKEELDLKIKEEENREESDLRVLKYESGLNDEEKQAYVPLVRGERKKFLSRMKTAINDFFGVPNGFTFWMKFKRTRQEKLNDAKAAIVPTILSGVTAAATVYSVSPWASGDFHLAPAVITSMLWSFFNIYTARPFTEWASQGKNVFRDKKNRWTVERNSLGLRLGLVFRNLLMSSMVLVAGFGFDEIMSLTNIGALVASNYLAVATRFWFEDWLMHRQATVLNDGTIVVEDGQFTPTKTTAFRGFFELCNSVIQSLALVNFQPAQIAISASGFFSTLRTVYKMRHHLGDHIRFFVDRVFKKSQAARRCETLIQFEKPQASSAAN